jgi:hypothetical protein
MSDLDDVLKELELIGMRTSQGTFVKVDAVKKILQKKLEVREEEEEKRREQGPPPKDFSVAKERAKGDPDLWKDFKTGPREPGKAVPASEGQPPRGR